MNKRLIALITGWTIVIMAIAAGFVFGYALPQFSTPQQDVQLSIHIQSNRVLYLAMLGGVLFIQILDVIASYTFFKFFQEDHRTIASISGWLRFIYTLIFIYGTVFLIQNFTAEEASNDWILSNFHLFQDIWTFGLIIFGIHILLLGYLMKLHGHILIILWIVALIAGGSYSLVSSLKLLEVNPEFTENLELVLALPMTIGELALAVWMIVKGGTHDLKVQKQIESVSIYS